MKITSRFAFADCGFVSEIVEIVEIDRQVQSRKMVCLRQHRKTKVRLAVKGVGMHHEKERIIRICEVDISSTHLAGLSKLGLALLPGLFVLLALLQKRLRDLDVLRTKSVIGSTNIISGYAPGPRGHYVTIHSTVSIDPF